MKSYAGYCKGCGVMVCAVLDDPARKTDVARHVSGWIRDGLRVELVENDAVRKLFGRCTCCELDDLPLFAGLE